LRTGRRAVQLKKKVKEKQMDFSWGNPGLC
jgi:hypothetical protein